MTHHPEDSVERLVRLAGERDLPSPEATRRARTASERAWRKMLTRSTPHAVPRRFMGLGLGLALAAGMAAAWWFNRPVAESVLPLGVGRVIAMQGAAVGRAMDKEWPLAPNQAIATGTTLVTQGRLALSFETASSLRMDRDTRLRIDARDHVTLLAGSLYVDSGGLNVNSSLRIATPAGEIGHIGTQFQVFVDDSLTRVQVREGRVSVTTRDATQSLASGDALEVRGTRREITHGWPTFGATWAWAAGVAAMLEIENRPLGEFLAWLAREQGWQLRYSTDELQEQVAQIRLHGTLDGMDSIALLERIALITGVPLQTRDGVLWVGAPR